MGVVAATNVLLAFGIGCAIGNIVGGVVGQRLYNRSPALLGVFMSGGTFISIFPVVAIINMSCSRNQLAMVRCRYQTCTLNSGCERTNIQRCTAYYVHGARDLNLAPGFDRSFIAPTWVPCDTWKVL